MNNYLSNEQLIDALTQQLDNTPAFHPAAIIGAALTLFCLPLLAGFILSIGFRSDWPMTALAKPAGFILLGCICLFHIIAMAKPLTKFPIKTLLLLPLLIICFGFLLSAPALSWDEAMRFESREYCLLWISSMGTVIYFSLRLILHRARPPSAHKFGAILGCFSAALAATFYATHCPQDALMYIIASYLPALIIVTTIGFLLPHKHWRW